MVETVFKTVKSQLVWMTLFQTRKQAIKAIGEYINGFYNPVRKHSALGYKSLDPIRNRKTKIEKIGSLINRGSPSRVGPEANALPHCAVESRRAASDKVPARKRWVSMLSTDSR